MILSKYVLRNVLISSCITIVFIALLSKQIYFRYDLSSERLFSLTESSKKIASQLPENLVIDLYYSQSHPALSAPYRAFCTRVIELLREFVAASKGKINLNIIDPRPDSDQEVIARRQGIAPIPAPNHEYIYFGAVFQSSSQKTLMANIDPNREEFIEFELAESMLSSMDFERKTVALFSSLDIFGGSDQNHEEWGAIKRLKKIFDVIQVDLNSPIPRESSVLVILHPQRVSDIQEYHIDQFLLQGGKIFLAIDPFSRAKHSRNRNDLLDGKQVDSSSSLPRLFANWGISYDPGLLVGDSDRAKQIKSIGRSFHYPFFISLTEKQFNLKHPTTGYLKDLLLAEPGSIKFNDKNPKLRFTPLIYTSNHSGTHTTDMALFLSPSDLTSRFKADGKKRVLSGILTGKFNSAFKKSPIINNTMNHIKSSTKEGIVTIIADIDFIDDIYSIEKIPFYNRTILKPKNDNQTFFLNTIEYMAGNKNLLTIRKGGTIKRPFLLFEELKKQAEQKYRNKEIQVSSQIKSLQHQIKNISEDATGFLLLTPDQEQQLKKLREQEAQLRLKRREVRYQLNADIDTLKIVLIVLNLISPIFIVFLVYLWTQRRRMHTSN